MRHSIITASIAALWMAMPNHADLLIDYGATWAYKIGTEEASTPDAQLWRQNSFDDSSWSRGGAPIGYANPPNNAAEENIVTTLPTSQQGNYLSVFLRKSFAVQSPLAVGELILNVQVDDGFVAWINGREFARYNVPDGELAFNRTAASAGEPALQAFRLSEGVSEWLVPGSNTLAIHLFNGNSTSSDLLLDAALVSNLDETRPVIAQTSPPQGAIISELELIEVLFNENVRGVDASDLRVNGSPASTVAEISPRQYLFTFPEPPVGQVTVSWASNHGISDFAPNPNFFSGATWTYVLDPTPSAAVVIISEFMADNERGIRDDLGVRSDWIELFNRGAAAMSLNGWFLSDDASIPAKWRIPAVTLDAGQYLLIWASGENRTNVAAPLHTNFKIGKGGGYLGLTDGSGTVMSAFAPYPAQLADISYGSDVIQPAITGFFQTPTPGRANSTSGSGFSPEVSFSVPSGIYTNSSLTIQLTAPSGQIRYTTDNSLPTSNSTLYSNPITLSGNTTIKARAFESGLLPGPIIAQNYILLDPSAAAFSSPLPLMVISTSGRSIAQDVAPGQLRTPASIITVEPFRGRSSIRGATDFNGVCELEIRGQSSLGFPKKQYNLELQDPHRNDLKAPLLGLPPGADWVLNSPYSDKPLLQNFLAFELHEQMGHYAVRRQFVELFLQTSSGKLVYPRDYVGVYLLVEKIKLTSERVDLARLTPYDITEPAISGGYMFKKDKDSPGDLNFNTSGGGGFSGQALKIHEPKAREITQVQVTWLRNYLNRFESAMYAPNWLTATGTNHYSSYIDVDSFVDHHWIVEFAKQIDGYRLSNYMHKDRNGKIRMEPIWDWNLSFGNADYLDGWNTSGWYWQLIDQNAHIWLRRLMAGTTSSGGTSGDPDFNQRVADRWSVLRTNIMNSSVVLARIDEMAGLLSEPAQRDFSKWPRLGTYVWPNPSFYVSPTTYAGIIDALKTWVAGRYTWIDSQFLPTPRLNHSGGRVPNGFTLSIAGSSIRYTLDGTDPRAPGGGIYQGALTYAGPLTLNSNTRVVARTRIGTRWSGPAAATFVVNPIPLRVTELMFNPPPPPAGSPYNNDDFEFVEILNAGPDTLDLRGFRIRGGIEFAFPTYPLPSDGRVLVVKNRAAFVALYGTDFPIAGEYSGNLNNSGEAFTLEGPLGETVAEVEFRDDHGPLADGFGFSIVSNHDSPGTGSAPLEWRQSGRLGGSPAQADSQPASFPGAVISEIVAHPAPGQATAVELHNLGSAPADLSGWILTDNPDAAAPLVRVVLPNGTQIEPGEFLVLSANALPQGSLFALDPAGGELWLLSAGTEGLLTGFAHRVEYGPQPAGMSAARHLDSAGNEHFPLASPSLGSPNPHPDIPPVVITEIMYRPQDVFANGAYWNNTEHEFIELHNRSSMPVPLSNSAGSWRLRGEVDFDFPPGISIPAGGFLLLAGFDPIAEPAMLAAFRGRYNLSASVPIAGPFRGNLNNRNGNVRLRALVPDWPSEGAPSILLEEVSYRDDAPWPAAADGLGFSLHRTALELFANDPAHWQASSPTPGAHFTSSQTPLITIQPAGGIAWISSTFTLRVAAVDTAPLKYQWRFNGSNLPGATNATLTLTDLQLEQSGQYSAIVMNASASTASANAFLSIALDSDSDGITDDWELDYGLDPFSSSDAALDSDNDGMTNLEEFIAGTDPRDLSSILRLRQFIDDSGLVLTFQAAPFRSYVVETASSIHDPAWQLAQEVAPLGQAQTVGLRFPILEAEQFFRLTAR